ncbi:MAG TPA: vWA domain-containing protein, partial [Acidimicrobiales bacterium]|nr:vWA domain-containing protein [Acidimicrobiales bacterium]
MASGVDPAALTLNLAEGGSATVNKVVHTPPIPPNPDIVFLVDITTSMGPVIANVQANASSVLSQVLAAQPTAQFAVADYKDQADPAPIFNVRQNLTADTGAVQAAINALSLSGGGSDAPEDWINALFEIATGAISFRSNGTRLVVLIGDSSSHDPSLFHSLGDATSALNDAEIRVIAIDVGPTPGEISDGLNAALQATTVAAATGGAYLVAPSPDQVSNVILAGLQNLPVTVTPSTANCDPNLSVSWSPASVTVTSGSGTSFAETIAVAPSATPGTTLACSVNFLLNGELQPGFTQAVVNQVPKHPSVLTVSDATSDFHDPGILSAVLTDGITNGPI